jgi:triacylglycerol lipase
MRGVAVNDRLTLRELVDLLPPTRESERFRYFEHWAGEPFEPALRELTLANAGWLAEAALLAYAPPQEAARVFANFRPKPTRIDFIADRQRDVECFVLQLRAAVVVVFRGSEVLRPDRWRSKRDAAEDFQSVVLDWTGNAKVRLVPIGPRSPRRAHRGFLAGLGSVWPALRARLAALQAGSPRRRFWFTGHSLGGALATLAADRFGRGVVVTFGAPRVGDAGFAATFRNPAWRVINNSDIVSWLPPPWPAPYRHVGRSWLITVGGDIVADPSRLREVWDFAQGHFEQVRGVLRGHVDAAVVECIRDHSPLLYVRRLRAAAPRAPAATGAGAP